MAKNEATEVDTAEQGDYTSGPRVITAQTKAVMKDIRGDIRSGKWAAAWVEENATGRKGFESTRKRERSHQIEKVGAQLRGMMPFLRPVTITDEEVNGATVSQNG